MNEFPEFMKNPANRIARGDQATPGVEGYVFDGKDGIQMAFWTCRETASSSTHAHEFDEYMLVVQGCYTLIIDGKCIPILASVAEFEREMIRERTLSGIRAAQAAGKIVGRPKRVFRRDEVVRLRDEEGLSWRAIGKKLGIPAMTALDSYRLNGPGDMYGNCPRREACFRRNARIRSLPHRRTELTVFRTPNRLEEYDKACTTNPPPLLPHAKLRGTKGAET